MEKPGKILVIIATILVIAFLVPGTRTIINEYVFGIKRIDEQINYNNRKSVEDTARSTIVNYNTYKNEYETYKKYCDIPYEKNKCQRSLDSKLLANQAVQQYNEFIQKNRFIFKDNLPPDIPYSLEKID